MEFGYKYIQTAGGTGEVVLKNGVNFLRQIYYFLTEHLSLKLNKRDHYDGKIPTVIRIRTFKNFGKKEQTIEVENVIMDNQNGQIEVAEIRWNKK